jgi:hypothetical protein|uniref:Uncharacterized protein n=1 Tax=Fagus sylvatica TaxID=28930 RepID=A0A2N9HEI1_FAGSY
MGRIARFLKAGKYAERVGAGAPVLRRSGADVSVASVENQHRDGAGAPDLRFPLPCSASSIAL